jgi:hypothetical protein
MSEVLTDGFPDAIRGGKYAYDELFDGQVRRLTAGDDFPDDKDVSAVRATLTGAARRRGLKLRTQTANGDRIVQAVPREDNNGKPAETPAKPAKSTRTRKAKS